MKDKAKYIEAIIDHAGDKDYIYTPLDLCDEMVSSITKLEGNILVIRNLEFIYTLYQKKVDMNTVHYSTNCDIKKQVAIQLGLDINNIYELDYNKKEINLGTEMKFDVIIQNPPYNPNSLWKKFVLKGIDLLKEDGQMVVIHPAAWRESSAHKKLYNIIIKNVTELHICDYESFKHDNVRIKTDWYLFNNLGNNNDTKCYFPDGKIENINLVNMDRLFRISPTSIPAKIISKVFTKRNNGMISEKGFNDLYDEKMYVENGIYKQCGGKGRGRGNGWTINKFVYTNTPSKNQFGSKVVAAYTHKPRAKYFSEDEQVGVILGNYWLTDNKSLPILLNSKMFWKLYTTIISPDIGQYGSTEIPANIPSWYYKSLNFDGLTAQTEEELYEHYGLTEEEIEWIEKE